MRHDSDDRLHASSEDADSTVTLRLTVDGSAQRSSQNCELPSVRRASLRAEHLFRPFCSAPQNVDFCVREDFRLPADATGRSAVWRLKLQ
jgi:hypothetical protein